MTDNSTDLANGKYNRTGLAATALRLAGASYTEVAEALGLADPHEARAAVEHTLAAQALNSDADRDHLRQEEAARYERLLRAVWTKAVDVDHPEQLAAARVAKELVTAHSKLLGLESPLEITVHTPTDNEIQQWVSEVAASQSAHLLALEATVIDVD